MNHWKKPASSELSDYQKTYVDKAPEGDLISFLETSRDALVKFAKSYPIEKHSYRYAPGKWTMPELLMHLNDSERIFAYRILRIARNDKTPLAGYEEDDYMKAIQSDGNVRSVDEILDEYIALRNSTIQLFKSMTDTMLDRTGIANGIQLSARALCFMLAGHQVHHLLVMEERY